MTLKYFNKSEFTCPCGSPDCTGEKMSEDFLQLLDLARDKASIPFHITSGLRCQEYNQDLIKRGYKASKTSSHLKGVAADISCKNSADRFTIINSLLLVGFSRIGISDTFIHVDLDKEKQQEVIWTY
tara:strand:- start:1106 stop:1486 length:381 start_codon:yes stop_codon:yes gene_type:complete